MLKTSTILISFVFVSLLSCDQKTDKSFKNFQTLVSDTSITHRADNEIDFSRKMNSRLSLPPIYKGVDSFELRIWVSNMIIPNRLIILKYDQGRWANYKYLYYPNDELIDSMTVYNKPIPKEVDKIVSFLKQKEILELPSQFAIPNFNDNIADGQTCTIEISTRHFYKALQYHCPEFFPNEPNNVKFMGIINYLNPHFKFYYPWCNPGE